MSEEEAVKQHKRIRDGERVLQAIWSSSTASGESPSLTRVTLQGKVVLPTSINTQKNSTMECVVLSESASDQKQPERPCLVIPVPQSNAVWLLQQVAKAHSRIDGDDSPKTTTTTWISRLQLRLLNTILTNRDRALFDNLPYVAWTAEDVLPDQQQQQQSTAFSKTTTATPTVPPNPPRRRRLYVDMANNPIAPQFHPGKRECYNRLMGKDWYRDEKNSKQILPQTIPKSATNPSSSTIPKDGTLWDQFQQLFSKNPPWSSSMETAKPKTSEDRRQTFKESGSEAADDATASLLAERMLQVQIREWQMDIAECDYEIAVLATTMASSAAVIASNGLNQTVGGSEMQQSLLLLKWQKKRLATMALLEQSVADNKQEAVIENMGGDSIALNWMKRQFLREEQQAYEPNVDAVQSSAAVAAAYASPYAMLQAILRDQMKAEVLGSVLENSSLLEGTTTMGGAVVLRRLTVQKSVTILGEDVLVSDTDETFGNFVKGGEILLIDCEADEAIGMSLACRVPLLVESDVWNRDSIMCQQSPTAATTDDTFPTWNTIDPEMSILLEGQASNQSSKARVAPVRISRSSTTLFDTLVQSLSEQQSTSKNLYPTDNPIQSLEQFDQMSNDVKVRTLMGMSNFAGSSLPRPRTVRSDPLVLDKLLVPLIDESVRRQYLIRNAKERGETQVVEELQSAVSQRGIAKQKAAQARMVGSYDVAEFWENEANLFGSLRADVTQDEGSYSRFLDRDEWYERDRQRMVQRMLDRKKG